MPETKYKVNIKVTTESDTVEVFLRRGAESEVLPKAKKDTGQDKLLVAGDYSVWIFGKPVPEGTEASIKISRTGSDPVEDETEEEDGLIFGNLAFRIEADGSLL